MNSDIEKQTEALGSNLESKDKLMKRMHYYCFS